MDKAEINNEIVSLRHAVRQARVCTVNKLIKEAKLLRNKHGNTKQHEKYKRKADKLIAEIYALKKIKDDDISKFGVFNEKKLKDILQNQTYSNKDHVIAKVVHYKPFYKRLMQFKEKFPDYKKYFSEGKKKRVTKSKKKDTVKVKKSSEKNIHSSQDEKLEKQEINSDENIEHSQSNSEDDETGKTELHKEKNNSHKHKKSLNKNTIVDKEKLVESSTSENVTKQRSIPCNVTKEAVVKRFEELVEEQKSIKEKMSAKGTVPVSTTIAQTKIGDDFFITGNEEEGYRDNSINTSMSRTRFDASVKTFRSSNRIRTQNAKHKNDTNLNKIKKYNQPRNQLKDEKISQYKKYLDKQSPAVERKKEASRKFNNSNSSDNNKEENTKLHPSWLAKKKEQEIMSQKFQGKRIVFAD